MKNTAMEENIKNALELMEKSADLYEQAQKILDEYGIQFLTPPQKDGFGAQGAKYAANLYYGINKLADACGVKPTHPLDYWKKEQHDRLGFVYNNIFLFQCGKPASKELIYE